MSSPTSSSSSSSRDPLGATTGPSRRSVLAAGGLAAAGLLGGCGGFGTKSSGGGGAGASGGSDTLTFTCWAGDAEKAAFQQLAKGFTAQGGPTVRVQVVPFTEALTTVDTGLRSNQAPDVFRVTYTDVQSYRKRGVLADLPDAARLKPAFGPAFWQAVTDGKGTFGVPQHTDTSMVLVNLDAVRAAGIGKLPTTRENAWTWEEFLSVARKVKAARPGKYAFAVNWQKAGAYRWLNWVDQAGGRLLDQGLTKAVVGSDAGARAALQYTQRFFTEGLVPRNSSTKGQDAYDLFATQVAAMGFVGDFLLADVEKVKFPWAATFVPRQRRESDDLGGNALVATKGPRQEQALKFLSYCAGKQQIADFCAATTVLPTRTDIDAGSLRFAVAPKVMPLYVEQAKAISAGLTQQVTVPAFNQVNGFLVERLEQAFAGRQDVGKVLAGLQSDVTGALRA